MSVRRLFFLLLCCTLLPMAALAADPCNSISAAALEARLTAKEPIHLVDIQVEEEFRQAPHHRRHCHLCLPGQDRRRKGQVSGGADQTSGRHCDSGGGLSAWRRRRDPHLRLPAQPGDRCRAPVDPRKRAGRLVLPDPDRREIVGRL